MNVRICVSVYVVEYKLEYSIVFPRYIPNNECQKIKQRTRHHAHEYKREKISTGMQTVRQHLKSSTAKVLRHTDQIVRMGFF